MKKTVLLSLLLLAACSPKEPGLKDAFEGKFVLGAAVNVRQIAGADVKGDSVLVKHFGAIEPENCMKSAEIMPVFGQYKWDMADKYVEFGEKNGLEVYGHCLIWHSQLTPDFCYDKEGNLIGPDELKARMKQHISTVVGRYKGRIKGWDVVNEAIMEDGSYRESPFYQILGKEFIPWAFQCAQEADPDLELYYNDYSMHEPKKLDTVLEMVKDLQARGIRIDAVGFRPRPLRKPYPQGKGGNWSGRLHHGTGHEHPPVHHPECRCKRHELLRSHAQPGDPRCHDGEAGPLQGRNS